MPEILLAAAIALVLLAAAAGEGVVHLLFLAGAMAVAVGLGTGIPAGIGYHAKLFRALSALGAAEPGWWWKPTGYHDRLPAASRRTILPWFRVGAAAFLVTITGCALILAAVLAQ